MDRHIAEYYRQTTEETPRGNFHKVIPLHERPDLDWKNIHRLVPNMPKGWYELIHLQTKDRIEFIRDFWLSKMPYHPRLNEFLTNFYSGVDDIGVFITQQKYQDPYEAQMVYSVKNSGFFRGYAPAREEEILELQKLFPDHLLPKDYTVFLQIHDGFCKTTDVTGIVKSKKMACLYDIFQNLNLQEGVTTCSGLSVNPKSLIPFYESFGMPYYQCFWAEWYPEQEMGNVYYSGAARTISDVQNVDLTENMAFPTFTDWLMFYLERIS